jgi:TPR repeat protein
VAAASCLAARGDKPAELELGKMLEAGQEIPADPARAARLYRDAARGSSGAVFVYVPGVQGRPGHVMPVMTDSNQRGEPEAAFLLAQLYWDGRGVKQDRKRALRLFRDAAQRGYAPAVEQLKLLDGAAP